MYGKYLNQMNDPIEAVKNHNDYQRCLLSAQSAIALWTTAHKAAGAARQARVGDRNAGFMLIGQTTLCPQPASAAQTPGKDPQRLIFV